MSTTSPLADLVAKTVLNVTGDWAKIKKKEYREQKRADRLRDQYFRGLSLRMTVKEAAYNAIPKAYMKASGEGRYPANARQIMYAARPAIQESTGRKLDDGYFTQILLPDYITEHPSETSDWDVVYDARGHLREPHTGREVSLGTLGVREYLERQETVDLAIERPQLNRVFPTDGPYNRYGAVLYIEKEGFLPLLEQAQFPERYDLAIMSSKGMGTTAARTLIERLAEDVPILVLHDFDKSGFSILGTLTRDTRRYQYTSVPQVIDLGLRLEDVQKWKLEAEDVQHKSDPALNLEENGATPEEIAFLSGEQVAWSSTYNGKRVELNAFTSDQFVEWLESKLQQLGIEKVLPNPEILEKAYRRLTVILRYQEIIDRACNEVSDHAAVVKIPSSLRKQLAKRIKADRTQSWDQALASLLPAKSSVAG